MSPNVASNHTPQPATTCTTGPQVVGGRAEAYHNDGASAAGASGASAAGVAVVSIPRARSAGNLVMCHAEAVPATPVDATAAELVPDRAARALLGVIALDRAFAFHTEVNSERSQVGQIALSSRTLLDTGASVSMVSDAFLQRATGGAVSALDRMTLERPCFASGFDKKAKLQRVTESIVLHLTPVAPEGATQLSFDHVFLIMPHLSHDLVVGRDLLDLHPYRMGNTSDYGHFCRFDPQFRDVFNGVDQAAASVVRIDRRDEECTDWQLAVVNEHAVGANNIDWVLVQVVDTSGKPVDVSGSDDGRLIVDVQHSTLRPSMLVVGSGQLSVPLETVGSAAHLRPGERLGKIFRAKQTEAEPGKLKALFCGAGGFSHGVKGSLDVRVAADNDVRACKVYRDNHPGTELIEGDLRDEQVRLAVAAAAQREGFEVVIGGPPCTHFSSAGLRVGASGYEDLENMVNIAAAVPSVRLVLLENVIGLASAPEMAQLKELALQRGFQTSVLTLGGDDCGLATTRRRLFVVMARGTSASVQHAHEWQAALQELLHLQLEERGKAGY